ncbi:uncharacterized protein LOC121390535 [Gigantopelta aegis]|uniref:uncharacterized protein LOC121390535 n=1 Tax=Gigantopelta aegis TaxID=1735272 RepID=UPI001B88D219|nr:uncharacterized protein LOC121390535 [Gigantopelta aegis]
MEGKEHMAHMEQVFLKMCSSDQSVVIGPDRHNKIVDVLLGYKLPSPSFKFWLKKNDFQLIDIPSMNETNILVAPGKQTSHSETRYVRVLRLEDIYPAVLDIHVNEQNHAGCKKCFDAASKLYYRLPRSYIEEFVRTCATCAQRKSKKQDVCATYQNMLTEKPVRKGVLEKIKVNTININCVSSAGFTHIGMVEDQHSKFIVLFPLKSNTPADVARALNNCYLGIFGPPLSFVSDNGHEFMDQVLHELLHLWNGIPLTLINDTSPNISAQDVSDRATIIFDTLSALILEKGDQKCAWHDWLPDIALRLNTTQNEFKRSPYNLVFGHNAHGGEYNSNVIIKHIEDNVAIGAEQTKNEEQYNDSNSHADNVIENECNNVFLEETEQNNSKNSESLLASVGLERRTSQCKEETDASKPPGQSSSKKLATSLLPVVQGVKKKKKMKKKPKPFTLAGCNDKVVVKATTSGVMNAIKRSKLGIVASASPNVHRNKPKVAMVESLDSSQSSEEESESSDKESSSEDEEADVLSFLRKGMKQKTKLELLKTIMTSLAVKQKNKKKKKVKCKRLSSS